MQKLLTVGIEESPLILRCCINLNYYTNLLHVCNIVLRILIVQLLFDYAIEINQYSLHILQPTFSNYCISCFKYVEQDEKANIHKMIKPHFHCRGNCKIKFL